jgi:hypothetical protein
MLPQMWGTFRWAARFLLLVMLAPAYQPLAMACMVRPDATHCMRVPASVQTATPAMPCHHAMAQSHAPQLEASFEASGNCCDHHCCCGATTSEWAQPAPRPLSFLNLLIELAPPSHCPALHSSEISGNDSARAPPR